MPGTKGRSGRHKLPTELKMIRGTYQKCRDTPNEPKPKTGIPIPARGVLRKDEKKQFDRVCKILNEMNVLAKSDVIALEILAKSLANYYEVEKDYNKQPRIVSYTDRNGNPVLKKSPTVNIMMDALKMVMTLLSRFGLEPSARASLNISQEDNNTDDDNPYANLLTRR